VSLVSIDPVPPLLRIYILAASPSARPKSVDVLDAAGTVVESAAVGD